MSTTKLYLSFDIEADGPSPCLNNMLSLGICGMTETGEIVYKYCENIKQLDNHVIDPDTKSEFWDKNPELWIKVNENQISCVVAMQKLSDDLLELHGKGYTFTWIAMPAAYDWQWLNYYWNYAAKNCADMKGQKLGFKAECLSTAWNTYIKLTKKNRAESNELWESVYGVNPSKHNAYYDALHQGNVYIYLLHQFD